MTARSRENHTVFLFVVALLSWLVPGAGYYLLREKTRALIIFITITSTLCVGLYIGSIGVLDLVGPAALYVKAAQVMNPPVVLVLGHVTAGRHLFGVGLELQSDLDEGIISEDLRQQFANKGVPLSADPKISTGNKVYEWLVTSDKRTYAVRREAGKLNIYRIYPVHGWPSEIGQIYTMTSGLLNLLCIVNAVYLAHLRGRQPVGG